MAKQLLTFNFEYKADNPKGLPVGQSHYGVVGSGDMEVLIEKKDQGGKATFTVVTPVSGFEEVWKRVLERFVMDTQIGDVHFEINDNNATPVVVSMRMRQALAEISG
ncbi:malonate decarboxylase acyl carrier protein [Microvirga sp. W0021]|uniref:Malonate decarboxylase acyl carrier protein n=1 Tax=Hohaiivirga grylli TaxID=3133970 RepID=A0ABV0BKT3_9HYPH